MDHPSATSATRGLAGIGRERLGAVVVAAHVGETRPVVQPAGRVVVAFNLEVDAVRSSVARPTGEHGHDAAGRAPATCLREGSHAEDAGPATVDYCATHCEDLVALHRAGVRTVLVHPGEHVRLDSWIAAVAGDDVPHLLNSRLVQSGGVLQAAVACTVIGFVGTPITSLACSIAAGVGSIFLVDTFNVARRYGQCVTTAVAASAASRRRLRPDP